VVARICGNNVREPAAAASSSQQIEEKESHFIYPCVASDSYKKIRNMQIASYKLKALLLCSRLSPQVVFELCTLESKIKIVILSAVCALFFRMASKIILCSIKNECAKKILMGNFKSCAQWWVNCLSGIK